MSASTSSALALAEIIATDPLNRVIGTNQSDHIEGYASIGNTLVGRGGADYILSVVYNEDGGGYGTSYGDGGNDTLETFVETYGGSARGDSFGGAGADDILLMAWSFGNGPAAIRAVGGAGNDRIEMLAFSDDADILAQGGAGNDFIRARVPGSVETDIGVVTAESIGRARLIGGAGRDTLIAIGGEGNEFTGGRGNDRSILSDGADTFIFAQAGNQGNDRIEHWDRAEDRLSLHGWDGTAEVTDNGTDVRAEFTNGSSITFAGVGDGTTDSIYDLTDDPGQIDWIA